MKDTKMCKGCNTEKPRQDFRNPSGKRINPKCKECQYKYEKSKREADIKEERAYIYCLKTIYGKDWMNHVQPFLLRYHYLSEFPGCLYCGSDFGRGIVRPSEDEPERKDFQFEHMDPLNHGGGDDLLNVVLSCKICNLRKGRKTFSKWTKLLPSEFKDRSEHVYFSRMGTHPDEFVPSEETPRQETSQIVLINPDGDIIEPSDEIENKGLQETNTTLEIIQNWRAEGGVLKKEREKTYTISLSSFFNSAALSLVKTLIEKKVHTSTLNFLKIQIKTNLQKWKPQRLDTQGFKNAHRHPMCTYQLRLILDLFYFSSENNFRDWLKLERIVFENYPHVSYHYLGHYIRELDSLSQKFNNDFYGSLVSGFYQEFYRLKCLKVLIQSGPDKFQKELIKLRVNLSPHFLLTSASLLNLNYKTPVHYKVIAAIFKVRVNSLFDKNNAKATGAFKFDKHFKSFLKNEEIEFDSDSCLKILDLFFKENYGSKIDFESDFFKPKFVTKSELAVTNQTFEGWNRLIHIRSHYLDIYLNKKECILKNNRINVLKIKSSYGSYYIHHAIDVLIESTDLSKKLQNFIRLKLGLKEVGKGLWITEELILKIVKKYSKHKVEHQWSPDWLGRQRIDIAIPKLKIAFEYNGKQHYHPIEFFGGKKALNQTKERDAKKAALCKKNKVKLYLFRFDQEIEEIEQKIIEILK